MATKAAVKSGTLELLGVLQIGQSISSRDSTRMDRAYNQVFDELKETGLATWAAAGPIPDQIVPHMEALMAFNVAETYYVKGERYQRILMRERMAKREIRRLSIPDYESLDEPVDY